MGENEDITRQLPVDERAETADQEADAEESEQTTRLEGAAAVVVESETQPTEPEADASLEPSDGTEADEIAAAVSAAEEKVVAPDSLDDIAPATTHPETPTTDPAPEPELDSVIPWWPFFTYLGAWIVLTAVAVWQLLQLPGTQVAYESQAYGLTVLGGLIMIAVGPLLILAVWFAVWANRSARDRAGLLTSSLLKGALVTLSGAVLWWVALIIVDYLRLGRPF